MSLHNHSPERTSIPVNKMSNSRDEYDKGVDKKLSKKKRRQLFKQNQQNKI